MGPAFTVPTGSRRGIAQNLPTGVSTGRPPAHKRDGLTSRRRDMDKLTMRLKSLLEGSHHEAALWVSDRRWTMDNTAKCPLTGAQHPDLYWCDDLPGSDICECCPAYGWRVRLYWWLRHWVWRIGLVLTALMALCTIAVAPTLADHNPAHSCPSAIAQAVLKGRMGGRFWANSTGSMATWTNGTYVCVFSGGQATTFFRSRNATQYLVKDAAKKGLKSVPMSAAKRLVGGSGSSLMALPCGVYQAYGLARCTDGVHQ